MRIFSVTNNRHKVSLLNEMPSLIEYSSGSPAMAHFPNGQCSALGCLGCLNPKCMSFEDYEIGCNEVTDFPNDKATNACPMEAIAWDERLDVPYINTEKCINCGICIRRCPVGAIYFDGSAIKVNTNPSPYINDHEPNDTTIELQENQINNLKSIRKCGVAILETDELLQSIYEKLFGIKSNYHNIIGRNLLISLGCNCSMRRIGDVYTRMDAIYSSLDHCFGAVEIEFGRDTLDASRGILDDIAVLYTRYGVGKDANTPLVICLQLPNARQGYWQVVKDVKAVEHISIRTVTIGALMLLNWNSCVFLPASDMFYLDYDNMDLRTQISSIAGRQLRLSDKLLGILEPSK